MTSIKEMRYEGKITKNFASTIEELGGNFENRNVGDGY